MLEQILRRDGERSDVLERMHAYLTELAQKMREGKLPDEKFLIAKVRLVV